jgi:nitrate reductase beta subunit
MEIKELKQFCCDRIANGRKTITLETESTRLLERGKHVVLYDALKVLQFLDKLENQKIKSKIRSK